MAAVALIKLSQGILTPPAGQALAGVGGVAFQIDNASSVDVQSWKIDLLYAPPGGSVSPGNIASSPNTGLASAVVVPDLTAGCYRIMLTVWPQQNYQGKPDIDIRNFAVPSARGTVFPPYQQLPPKLPILGSGAPGEKPDELNFGGQVYGWDGDGTDGLMLQFMRSVDSEIGGGFSLTRVSSPKSVPEGQMMLYDRLNVESTLGVAGAIMPVRTHDNFMIDYIPPHLTRTVHKNDILFFTDLEVDGELILDGEAEDISPPDGQDILDLLTSVAPNAPALLGVQSPAGFILAPQVREMLDVPSNSDVQDLVEEEVQEALDDLGLSGDLPWSDTEHSSSWNAEIGKLNRYTAAISITCLLPANPSDGDVIGFYNTQLATGSSLQVDGNGRDIAVGYIYDPSGTLPIFTISGVLTTALYFKYDGLRSRWVASGDLTLNAILLAGTGNVVAVGNTGYPEAVSLSSLGGAMAISAAVANSNVTGVADTIQRYDGSATFTFQLPSGQPNNTRVALTEVMGFENGVQTIQNSGSSGVFVPGAGFVVNPFIRGKYVTVVLQYHQPSNRWIAIEGGEFLALSTNQFSVMASDFDGVPSRTSFSKIIGTLRASGINGNDLNPIDTSGNGIDWRYAIFAEFEMPIPGTATGFVIASNKIIYISGTSYLKITHDDPASNVLQRVMCPGGVDFYAVPGDFIALTRDVAGYWRVHRVGGANAESNFTEQILAGPGTYDVVPGVIYLWSGSPQLDFPNPPLPGQEITLISYGGAVATLNAGGTNQIIDETTFLPVTPTTTLNAVGKGYLVVKYKYMQGANVWAIVYRSN